MALTDSEKNLIRGAYSLYNVGTKDIPRNGKLADILMFGTEDEKRRVLNKYRKEVEIPNLEITVRKTRKALERDQIRLTAEKEEAEKEDIREGRGGVR